MYPRLLTLFLVILPFLGDAQDEDPYVDSLNTVLKQKIADSTRVNTLIELASNYYRTDPSEAYKLAVKAQEIAETADYKSGLANAHKAEGMSFYFQGDYVNALVQWRIALDVYSSIGDMNGVSNMLNNLGAVHYNGGDNETALDYYLQSLKVAEETYDTLRTVTALINIGSLHMTKDQTQQMALENFRKALPISKEIEDYDAIGTCAVNMGEIYLSDTLDPAKKETSIDSALYFFEMGLDAYQKSATGNIAFAMNSIGKVYQARQDYDTAIQYQTEAFGLAKGLEAPLEMAQIQLSLASTYDSQGDKDNAIRSYNLARELAVGIGADYEIFESYMGLAEAFSKIPDFRRASEYYKLSGDMKDTLYDAEMDKKLQAQTLSYDIEKKQGQISLLEKDKELKDIELKQHKLVRNATGAVGLLLLLLAAGLFNRYKYTKRTSKIIAREKERSENLLLNILPSETAEELKAKGSATPRYYEKVSVLFTDFKGFTKIAEKLSPQELVEELNTNFLAFDEIIDKHGLEKIKTIGDAYMCAGGIPVENDNNPVDIVNAALEIKAFTEELKKKREAEGKESWDLRIGVHTGPVIAGVVGKNKFAYDIWGDAVNVASRMESSGIPGQVNISGETYELVKDHFVCKHRGKVEAKNKGQVDMYIVEAPAQVETTGNQRRKALA